MSENCLSQFISFIFSLLEEQGLHCLLFTLRNENNGLDTKKSFFFSLNFHTRHEGSGLQTSHYTSSCCPAEPKWI